LERFKWVTWYDTSFFGALVLPCSPVHQSSSGLNI
jgi:hypothetical protein